MNFLDWTHKQITETRLFNAETETRHVFSTKLTQRSRITKCLGQSNEKMRQNVGSHRRLETRP